MWLCFALLQGRVPTAMYTSRLNVEHVCEAKSQSGVCGVKVWQAVVFTCVCVFVSLVSLLSTERGQKGSQPLSHWGGPVLSDRSPDMKHHTGYLCADAGMWMHHCTSGKSVQSPEQRPCQVVAGYFEAVLLMYDACMYVCNMCATWCRNISYAFPALDDIHPHCFLWSCIQTRSQILSWVGQKCQDQQLQRTTVNTVEVKQQEGSQGVGVRNF